MGQGAALDGEKAYAANQMKKQSEQNLATLVGHLFSQLLDACNILTYNCTPPTTVLGARSQSGHPSASEKRV